MHAACETGQQEQDRRVSTRLMNVTGHHCCFQLNCSSPSLAVGAAGASRVAAAKTESPARPLPALRAPLRLRRIASAGSRLTNVAIVR